MTVALCRISFCIDARHAKAALSMQINKTDRNDAFGLAQIMRTGWYREVGVKSIENHKVRAVLGARAQLVGMRTDIRNQIRGLLKVFGVVLERNSGKSLEEQVREAARNGDDVLQLSLRSLLATLKTVCEQAEKLGRMAVGRLAHSRRDLCSAAPHVWSDRHGQRLWTSGFCISSQR
jgi:transposase